MPTILTHAAVPLIAGWALGSGRVSPRLVIAGMVAAMLPDADVLGFRFGIPYGSPFGHRGFTHSLLIAALVGLAASWGASWLGSRPRATFAFVAASAASHGLLDMITNGGRGIALLWPVSTARLFAPWRPVEVSPIGLGRLVNGDVLTLALSELKWIILPAFLLALLYRRFCGRTLPNIDLAAGQP